MPPPPLPRTFLERYGKYPKRRLPKRALLGLILSFSALIGLLWVTEQALKYRYAASKFELSREFQRKYQAEFDRDQTALRQSDLFPHPRNGQDAGPLLNAALPWQSSARTRLTLPPELINRIKGWKGDFMDHAHEVDFTRIDLAWMADLSQFDHWDLDRRSPIEHLYFRMHQGEISPNYFLAKTPTPDFKTLLRYANLRWMKAALDGDFASAGKQTRDLVRLLYSTEYLSVAFVGVNLLGIEARVGTWLQQHTDKVNPNQKWQFVSMPLVKTAARVLKAYPGYWKLTTPPKTLAKLFLAPEHNMGLCHAIREGIYHSYPLGPLLKPSLALEQSFQDEYARLDASIRANQHRCRLTFHKTIWEEIPAQLDDSLWQWSRFAGNRNPNELPKIFFRLPFTRRALGYSLAQTGIAGAFKNYRAHQDTVRE